MNFRVSSFEFAVPVLLGLLLLAGCGILGESVDKNFTARTRISADVPKGAYSYDSTKDQQIDYIDRQCKAGEADVTQCPTVKEFHVKSNTPEAAIASAAKAVADSQAAFSAVMGQFIQTVAPIIQGALKGGSIAGGPGAAAGGIAGALAPKAPRLDVAPPQIQPIQ